MKVNPCRRRGMTTGHFRGTLLGAQTIKVSNEMLNGIPLEISFRIKPTFPFNNLFIVNVHTRSNFNTSQRAI